MQVNIHLQGSISKIGSVLADKLSETQANQERSAANAVQTSPVGVRGTLLEQENLSREQEADTQAVAVTLDSLRTLLDAALMQAADQGVRGVSLSVSGGITARNVSLTINFGELPNFIG